MLSHRLFVVVLLTSEIALGAELLEYRSFAVSRFPSAVTDGWRVKVNGDALTENDASVTLEGVGYQVAYSEVECRGDEGFGASRAEPCRSGEDFGSRFWLKGSAFPSVLTRHKGFVAGVIYSPSGRTYELRPGSEGEVLRESKENSFECEVGNEFPKALSPKSDSAGTSRRRAVAIGGKYGVDLAEFWTPLAEADVGGRIQMETIIRNSVDMLNSDTRQSGIPNLTFRLVYLGPLNFTEIPAPGDNLGTFRSNQEVVRIRAEVGADLCGLWIQDGRGIAYAPRFKNAFAPANGFHVNVGRADLAWHGYSHEVFHNFGGQHNEEDVAPSGADEYKFARDMCTVNWITILSYNTCVPVGRFVPTIPYITNPELSYQGTPLGAPEKMDNVRMVRLSMGWVASYLPSK